MIRRVMLIFGFMLVCTVPAFAQLSLELPAETMNGQAFFVKVQSDSSAPVEIQWDGRAVDVACTGHGTVYTGLALLSLPRDYAGTSVQVRAKQKSGNGDLAVGTLPVVLKKYKEQHLKVNKKFVELDKKSLDKHYKDKAEVAGMMKSLSEERMWDTAFVRPVSGGVSSDFGVQRFFNGKPRKPHSGVDLRGKTGTPIKSCADGIVRIANNHFFSGNSVYIDHGQGVVSMYFHLSKILVRQGEPVKKGQVIGKVGATGRVTGPHLHFGLKVSGVAVDPVPLFPQGK